MLKVGIVGAGAIADSHIEAFLRFPELCRIVAIADPVPGRIDAKRAAHGLVDVAGYSDGSALLEVADVDLVSIATPPATHAPLTIQALEAGIDVIVEKPMAPSLEECDAMLAAQRTSGRLLSVIAQNRFRDELVTLHEVMASGLIGDISQLRIDSAWWRGLPYYDLSWRGTWESEGGGCTLNHAIHHIDLMLWLMGRPSEVTAMLSNAQHENAEVEDLSVAILRYGRSLASLTSSTVHHGEEQAIVVQARDARISQPWRVVAEKSQPNGFPVPGGNTELVSKIDSFVDGIEPLAHTGHAGQVGDVLAAIAAGREPAITGTDGRNAVEVVTAIYKSGIEKRFVALPLDAEDPYYRAGTLTARAPHFFEKRESVREQDGEIVVGASTSAF